MATFGAGLMRCMCVSLWLAALPLGSVADAADFYKDRTITFIIGSARGGGYDTYGRLVASHLGRHIGGSRQLSRRTCRERAASGPRTISTTLHQKMAPRLAWWMKPFS